MADAATSAPPRAGRHRRRNNAQPNPGTSPSPAAEIQPQATSGGRSGGRHSNRGRSGRGRGRGRGAATPRAHEDTPKGNQNGHRSSNSKSQRATPPPPPRAATPQHGTPPNSNTARRNRGDSASKMSSQSTKNQRQLFAEHMDPEQIAKRLAVGGLFRGTLRVNANDKTQGFATIPGLPTDVFIRGFKAQNRAVEGDEVAIRILPLSEWYHRSGGGQASTTNARQRRSSSPTPPPASPSISLPADAKSNIRPFKLDSAVKQPVLREMTPPVWAATSTSADDAAVNELLSGDDIVAMPSMLPSPSGGELDINIVRDPLEASNDGADFEGEDSMIAFLAREVQQQVKIADNGDDAIVASDDAAAPPPPLPLLPEQTCEVSEWETCSSPKEALQVIADLLNGDFDGWRATAEVVGVLSPSPRRSNLVGVLRCEGQGLFLMPCDPRMPRALVGKHAPPKNLQRAEWQRLLEEAQKDDVPRRTLVAGCFKGWSTAKPFPMADITRVVGPAGELQFEVEALLSMERVNDDDQFNGEILACLPPLPWSVSASDLENRRDFRDKRVFSIDPPTARDLDDALSVEDLGNGLLRIGVHIADVSHFVRPATPLDDEAAERATSVYLVDRVIPMLPRPLCEDLCSLNPGVERLCMSVVWDMNQQGEIQSTWMGRTVIKSCAKLSYPQVQVLIEASSPPSTSEDAPEGVVLYDGHRWSDVAADALHLHHVAQAMRTRRFDEGGSLRLDNSRLYFQIDDEGNPIGYGIYEQKEANRLVEEFMLRANMSAAEFISSIFPARALLRRHPAPNEVKMAELATTISTLLPNLPPMEVSSAACVHASLTRLREALSSTIDPAVAAVSKSVMEVVTMLCTKPMQLAKYFCTGDVPDPLYWRHYALAVGHYTHFTSPIRRYPDIIVHRLIAAALDLQQQCEQQGLTFVPQQVSLGDEEDEGDAVDDDDVGGGSNDDDDVEDATAVEDPNIIAVRALESEIEKRHGLLGTDGVSTIADHSNERKLAAKATQDGALRLYLASYLLEQPGVYMGVIANLGGHRFFDVYVPALGVDVRVYTADALQGRERALSASWDAKNRVLSLAPAGSAKPDQVAPTYNDVNSFDKLRNPDGIAPIVLPLELQALSTVPLVVCARKSKTSGSPAGVHAKLWLCSNSSSETVEKAS